MTPFDWAVCALFLFSVLVGFLRGFVRETLGLLSWLIAGFATVYLMPSSYEVTLKVVPHPLGALILSGSVIFLLLLVFLLLLSDNIVAWTKGGMLRMVDRFLGLLFGGLRGIIFLWIACWVALFLVPHLKVHSFLEHSQTLPFLTRGAEILKESTEKYLVFEKALQFFKKNLEPLLNDVISSHLNTPPAPILETSEENNETTALGGTVAVPSGDPLPVSAEPVASSG